MIQLPPEDLTPPSDHARVLAELARINATKRADYTGNEGPWANFERAGDQLGVPPGHVAEMHIATKQARLRSLLTTGRTPNHESVRDTLLDRANYSVIAVALYDAGLYHLEAGDGGQTGSSVGSVVRSVGDGAADTPVAGRHLGGGVTPLHCRCRRGDNDDRT